MPMFAVGVPGCYAAPVRKDLWQKDKKNIGILRYVHEPTASAKDIRSQTLSTIKLADSRIEETREDLRGVEARMFKHLQEMCLLEVNKSMYLSLRTADTLSRWC